MPATRPLTDWTDPWEGFSAPSAADVRPAGSHRARTQSAPPRRRPRPASPERARRLRHLRALRRDLLVDVAAAFALMVFVVIATAGLGVVLLLEIPVGVLVVASFVIERRRRRRR